MKSNLSYCWDKMIDEDIRPLREFFCKESPSQHVVIMSVDFKKQSATLFYKEIGDVRKETFEWCRENLVLLNEFNR